MNCEDIKQTQNNSGKFKLSSLPESTPERKARAKKTVDNVFKQYGAAMKALSDK